jgi:hypothetical protein
MLLAASPVLLADFSYEENSRITGGALAGAMKVAAVFSKAAREPMRSTVYVKGNRMAHLSASHGSVIDLDNETITQIDFQKKTWSVTTFAEMRKAMEQASEKAKERQPEKPGGDMQFKVSVNDTGQSRTVNGLSTNERIMRVDMEMTDDKGQKGTMVMTTDAWVAPKVPGYEEVLEFYKKMAVKLAWVPGQLGMMARPDLSKGMTVMAKESGRLEGIPVYETLRMGTEGLQGQAPPPGEQPKPQAHSQQPSVGSALGGALGGRFGLGKKKQPQQETPPPSSSPSQPENNGAGMLMEMVKESANFSAAPIDASIFAAPAGFKQVKPDMRTGSR